MRASSPGYALDRTIKEKNPSFHNKIYIYFEESKRIDQLLKNQSSNWFRLLDHKRTKQIKPMLPSVHFSLPTSILDNQFSRPNAFISEAIRYLESDPNHAHQQINNQLRQEVYHDISRALWNSFKESPNVSKSRIQDIMFAFIEENIYCHKISYEKTPNFAAKEIIRNCMNELIERIQNDKNLQDKISLRM